MVCCSDGQQGLKGVDKYCDDADPTKLPFCPGGGATGYGCVRAASGEGQGIPSLLQANTEAAESVLESEQTSRSEPRTTFKFASVFDNADTIKTFRAIGRRLAQTSCAKGQWCAPPSVTLWDLPVALIVSALIAPSIVVVVVAVAVLIQRRQSTTQKHLLLP